MTSIRMQGFLCRHARYGYALAMVLIAGVAAIGLFAAAGCESATGTSQPAKASDSRDSQPAAAAMADGPGVVDHARLHPGFDPQSPCTCSAAMLGNMWCWRCNVGYVAGRRIECARLFEALDPHGHELDNESLQLQMCREAIRSDGYCDAIGIGFVAGKAYFTRLTYGVAKGMVIDPATLACTACQSYATEPGWCEPCRRGIVGNVAFPERDMFDRTAREYRTLTAAIDKAPVCEFCACAMVAHLTCPKCQISYESEASASSSNRGDSESQRVIGVQTGGVRLASGIQR